MVNFARSGRLPAALAKQPVLGYAPPCGEPPSPRMGA